MKDEKMRMKRKEKKVIHLSKSNKGLTLYKKKKKKRKLSEELRRNVV